MQSVAHLEKKLYLCIINDANMRRITMIKQFDSLVKLANYFTNDTICKDFIASQRWADGDVVCPYCGEHHCTKCADGRYICHNRECHRKFNVTVGTIFESTKVSLVKWFMAIYLVSAHKKGISSVQLSKDIDVTQKTAWYMLMKIRTIFAQTDEIGLCGDVEVDEMYNGGKQKWMHESKKKSGTQGGAGKTSIIGLVERDGGRVVAVKTADTKSETVIGIIEQFVCEGSVVYTDESSIYKKLTEKTGLAHKSCNHSQLLFSDRKGTHTNGIEGFWAHFRKMVYGIYHMVSEDYLQRYIDEECFRWNTRKMGGSERFSALWNACCGVVTYADVVSLSSREVKLNNTKKVVKKVA